MAVVASVVAASLALTGTAGAQDPYGGTTTTTAPGGGNDPSCGLDVTSGNAGDTVVATIFDVPPGTLVRVLFDGVEVARATAPGVVGQSVGAPVAFGGVALPAQASTVDLQVPFTIPSDAGPGTHTVTAVGDTFSRACELLFDIGGTGGGTDGGTDGGTGGGTSGGTDTVVEGETESPGDTGGGLGALPRTGIAITLLLALAAILVLGGRALLDASRRRGRKAAHSASS